MRKAISGKFFVLFLCLAVCLGSSILVRAEEAEASAVETWTNENTVEVYVEEPYIDEIRLDPEAAFARLNPAAVYINQLRSYDTGGMKLLIVLPESGEEAQKAAIEALLEDPRVSSARPHDDAPFESVNTLHLVSETDTLYVGDSVTIRPEGELHIYWDTYQNTDLFIIPKNYDHNKKYAIEDFPQVSLKAIQQYAAGYLQLTLDGEATGYFQLVHAAHTLATSPDIYAAWTIDAPTGIRPAAYCTVSNPSVAQFTKLEAEEYADDTLVGKADENGDYILEALAPGKVTVTYYNHYINGKVYTAQTEITVVKPEASLPDGTSDMTDETTSETTDPPKKAPSQSDNPKTGDQRPTLAAVLLLVGLGGILAALRKADKKSI